MSSQLHLLTFILLHQFIQGGVLRHGIIHGRESVPYSHPYMVYLIKIIDPPRCEYCDGFLVREDFVLTAAHCYGRGVLLAYLGVNDTTKIRILKDATFVKSFPHPNYNNITFENDIMLLKLKNPAEINTKVRTIALPESENDIIPHDCLVMGWGCQTFTHENKSTVLREANITLSNINGCTQPDMICSKGDVSPGRGDSGGPLVCGGVAHGIVSSLYSTDKHEHVARYTRVSYYLKWIHFVMKRN